MFLEELTMQLEDWKLDSLMEGKHLLYLESLREMQHYLKLGSLIERQLEVGCWN